MRLPRIKSNRNRAYLLFTWTEGDRRRRLGRQLQLIIAHFHVVIVMELLMLLLEEKVLLLLLMLLHLMHGIGLQELVGGPFGGHTILAHPRVYLFNRSVLVD